MQMGHVVGKPPFSMLLSFPIHLSDFMKFGLFLFQIYPGKYENIKQVF
jgi:hypothetical protein